MFRPIFVSLFVAAMSAMALGASPESAGVAFDDPTPVAPATQPINQSAAQPVNTLVVVLPIAPPSTGDSAWIGRAIQQDMVIDLGQMTHTQVVAPPSAVPAINEQAALDQARQMNAGFVVYGQAQMSGNQIRVVGQLLDVSTAKPLAGLKATAPADNLFPLEDSLAGQVAHALPYPLGMAGAPQPPAQAQQQGQQQQPSYASEPPPQNQPYSSAQVSSAPQGDPYYSYVETYPQTYYAYNPYYYSYPYWSYPYGGVWIGVGGYYHSPYYWHGGGYYGHPYYGGAVFARPGFRGGGGFRGGAVHSGGGGRR